MTAAPKPAVRILTPADASSALVEKFHTALAEAAPQLQRYTPGRSSGNVVLFDDGDYVFFTGPARPEGDRTTIQVNSIVAQNLSESSPRSRIYGRLVPGNTLDVTAEGLSSVAGVEPAWQESLRRGEEFEFFTFGP